MKSIELEVLLNQPLRSLMRVLLDVAPVASSIAIDGKVVYANAACARLWAFEEPARMLGLSFFDLIAPWSQDSVIAMWRARRDGSEALTSQLTGLRSDGSTFEYVCTSVSLEMSLGKATFAFFEELHAQDEVLKAGDSGGDHAS